MKKKIGRIALVLMLMLSLSISAFAGFDSIQIDENELDRAVTSQRQAFDIKMHYNPSEGSGWVNSTTSAYKSDNAQRAFVDCDSSAAYWPRTLRIRIKNSANVIASETITFGNGGSGNITYNSGQNYPGNKWLNSSISDAHTAGYTFTVKGTWIP